LLFKAITIQLQPITVGILTLGFMLILLFLGLPVAFTMGLIGILGTWYRAGLDTCMGVIRMCVYESVATYSFNIVNFIPLDLVIIRVGSGRRLPLRPFPRGAWERERAPRL